MRPQGEIRQAVVSCIAAQPCTLREVVARANVGYDSARWVLKNAIRAGQVSKAGTRREPHSKRPVAVYRPADPLPLMQPWQPVGAALSAWAR